MSNDVPPKTPKERTYLIYGALAGVISGGLIGIVIGGEWATFFGAVLGVLIWLIGMEVARKKRKDALGR